MAFWLLSLGDEIFTFEMSLEFGLSVWSRFLDGALIASPGSGEETPQGPFSPPLRPCATRRHQNFLTPHSVYQINFTSLQHLRGHILRTLADRVCKDYLVLICNILIFFKNVDLEWPLLSLIRSFSCSKLSVIYLNSHAMNVYFIKWNFQLLGFL